MAVTREDVILRMKLVGTNQFKRAMNGMNKTMKKMKFEWLGIMFAGMAITRVFGGLIRAQLNLLGVTDLMSAAWTVVLLPAMELLLPVIMRLIDLFMNLPEGIQMAIGIFVILATGIGVVMSIVGQLALGIGALAVAMGVSFAAVGLAILGVVLIIAGVGLIIGGIIEIVKNWGKIWHKVFQGMGIVALGIGVILLAVFGWVPALIAGIVALFFFLLSWFAKKFPQIGEFFQKWFWEVPKKFIGKLWDFLKGVFRWIGDKFGGVFNFVGGLFGGKGGTGVLGSFATGGVIPRTGPYQLHAGETVIPAGQTNNLSPNITINVSGSGGISPRRLADELKRYWVEDFEKVSQGRSL